ncbi:MAG: hypothetical protein Ct9H90mP11_10920 [Acidimicrobiales bacterium]|nr:MAG: hypothetical protein Ct9H90mP11_10920 [Acidimicrobiales bacterium]
MKMAQVLTEGNLRLSKVFAENFSEGDQSASCDEILDSNDNELGPLSDLPPDAEIEFFEDDSWCGYNFTASFLDLGAVLEEDDGFPITEVEGIATFRLPADDLFGDVTGEADQAGEDIDSAMLLKALGIPEPEFVISVTIAGEILEQNADEVRGSTLIWNFNILDPQPGFEPYAVVDTTVSSSGSSGTSGGLIALIVIAALVSLTLLGVLQKRLAAKKDATETDFL